MVLFLGKKPCAGRCFFVEMVDFLRYFLYFSVAFSEGS